MSAVEDDDDFKATTVAQRGARPPAGAREPAGTEARAGTGDDRGQRVAGRVRVGDVLGGKYEVGQILGQGGVGVVVAANHLLLNQKVAIKLLLTDADQEGIARFLREGQSAARLKGDHVARVLDMGQLPEGAPFMVMEFLEGRDLAAELEARGLLPIEEAVAYLLHACEAMAEAHAAGIVHRDLKPANLFLTTAPDGSKRVKVVDFGISKDLAEAAAGNHRLTRTTSVFGSPLYMSPEQMRATRTADARADIWSLGIILYELLLGRPPFDAEMYAELVLKVATEAPEPLSNRRPDVPEALSAAILRCLEKKPEQRYADVGELAADIAPFGPASAGAAVERIRRLLEAAPAGRASGAGPASQGTASWAGGSQAGASSGAAQAGTTSGGTASRGEPGWATTRAAKGQPRRELLKVAAMAVAGAVVVAAGAVAFLGGRQTAAPEQPGATESAAAAIEGAPPGSGEVRVTPGGSAGAPEPAATPTPAEATPAPMARSAAPRPSSAPAGSAGPKGTAASAKSAPASAAPAPETQPEPDPLQKMKAK